MLKNSCKLCGKISKDKICSKVCRNILNTLRKSCKDCYLLDIKYFLSKYKQDEAYRKYRYIKNFEPFLLNKIIYNNVPILEYIQVLNNIENEKIELDIFKKYNVPNNKNQWIILGFSNLTSKIIADLFSTSKNGFISRFGLIEGNNKYKEWKNKSKDKRLNKGYPKEDICFSKEYWIKRGYSEYDSVLKTKEINTRNLDYFVKKYGKNDGNLKYNNMINKRSFSNSKDGFIERHSLEEWNKLVKKKTSFNSLDFYIKKYGEIKGKEKYREYIKSNLESKIAIKFKNCIKNNFFNIYCEFPIEYWSFDYKIDDNILVEINGDWWRMNPNLYEEDIFNKMVNMTARNIWNKDKNKINSANELGYSVISIWECAINKNIKKVKEEVLKSVEQIKESKKILNYDINLINNKEFRTLVGEYNNGLS